MEYGISQNKTIVKFLKFIIFIISISFLVYVFINKFNEVKTNILFIERKYILIEIAFLSLFYAFILSFVAKAWQEILTILLKRKMHNNFMWLWLQTNIYKYMPGNIFNYVGRQIVSKKWGIEHKIIIQSNLMETLLITSTSLMLSSLTLILFYKINMNKYFLFFNPKYIFIGLIIYISVLLFFYKFKQIKLFDYKIVIFYYLFFFFGVGVIAYYIINYQMGIQFPYLLITAIYTLAWLVGFLTPGAPGGIGVRESVFIILSHGLINEANAIILSMMLRFISIIGESILFIIANRELNKKR